MQPTSIPTGDRNPRGHTAAEVLAALQGQATYTAYDALAEEDGMTLVIPDRGEQVLLNLALSTDLYLRLYSTDTTVLSASAREALTEDDLTEATFTGYTAKTLTGGSWTSASGAPASAAYATQGFVSTINQDPETLYGYYVTKASSGFLVWFEEFSSPVTISGYDEYIEVTPRFTLQDTGD